MTFKKGYTVSAETRAKLREAALAREARRRAEREHAAIHATVPRNCHPKHLKQSIWQAFKQWFGGAL